MEKNVVLSPISCFLFALWKQNNDSIYRSDNSLVRTLYLMHLPGEARRQRDCMCTVLQSIWRSTVDGKSCYFACVIRERTHSIPLICINVCTFKILPWILSIILHLI